MDAAKLSTPMPDEKSCPQCGTPLSPGALAGLCPACLLKIGAAADTVTDAKSPPFHPPAITELAAKFPQLEILELIGQGGMGAVYKARQKQLDRIVALKILPPGIGHEPAFAERFTREAKALAKLNHPNIVTLYEFGETSGQFYFLMEFVDGVNLRQLLQSGRISPREALAIVPQICDALQFAHDQGIVHRDIKPENILLDRRGRVKVADFGLAKIISAEGGASVPASRLVSSLAPPASDEGSLVLTDAGKIMGTPNYMSPEQKENPGEVDHRADIYALGVVFYQMLTGELPGKKIEPPSRKVHIDVRLDEIVLRALAQKPELRFQQASVLKTQIETVAASAEQSDVQSQKPKVKSRFALATGVAFAVFLLVLALAATDTFLLPKTYCSTARIMLHSEKLDAAKNEAEFSWLLRNAGLFPQSSEVLNQTAKELDLKHKWAKRNGGIELSDAIAQQMLRHQLVIKLIPNTGLVSIGAYSENANEAAEIANKYAEVTRAMMAKANFYEGKFEADIVAQAVPGLRPVKPNIPLNLFCGALAGIFLGLVAGIVSLFFKSKSGFGAAHQQTQSRFSRIAIVGIGFVILGMIFWGAAYFVGGLSEAGFTEVFDSMTILELTSRALAALGTLCLLASAVLGWISVSQIRRAKGKLHGSWLAIFNGSFSSLLLITLATILIVVNSTSDNLGGISYFQTNFPYGDSIQITSVERSQNQMTVKGHYHLVSHDEVLLALYVTTTNAAAVPTDSKQQMNISKGDGNFELIDAHLISGLPHVSMYADGHPFATIYFGTKTEAAKEGKLYLASPLAGSFNPVIKQTLVDQMAIDFDSGKVGTDYYKETQRRGFTNNNILDDVACMEQEGMDARVVLGRDLISIQPLREGNLKPDLLFIAGMKIEKLNSNAWDGMSPSELKQSLVSVKTNSLPFRSIQSINSDTNMPATYGFQTRDSNYGVLQIVGFTANNPPAMKIRYKLVQSAKSALEPLPTKTITLTRATNQLIGAAKDLPTVMIWSDTFLNPGEKLRSLVKSPDGQIKDAQTTFFTRCARGKITTSCGFTWFFKDGFNQTDADKVVAQLQPFESGRPLVLTASAPLKLFSITNRQGGVMSGYVEFDLADPQPPDAAGQIKATVRIKYAGIPSIPSLGFLADVPGGYVLRATANAGEASISTPAGPYDYNSVWFQPFHSGRRLPPKPPQWTVGQGTDLSEPFEVVLGKPKLMFSITNGPGDVFQGFLELVGPTNTANQSSSITGQDPAKAAIQAAQTWLELIDSGNYSNSWKEASAIFQGAVTETAWVDSLNLYRKPAGVLLSRQLKSAQSMTEMPGAPDGHYVVMQFTASFTDKKSAIETVTFVLEKDGRWKSSGYFIK